MGKKKQARYSPARIILTSILFTIGIGTALLSLPYARTAPIPLIDIFFTATSATTVTGLLTIPLNSFTFFGQFIIMIMIQIGGLGLITLSLFLLSLFVEIGLATQFMAGAVLELKSWKETKQLLIFIIGFTLLIETIGSVVSYLSIRELYEFPQSIFLAVFHAISSFCSAGFCLFPGGMVVFKQSYSMLCITGMLMIIGGLGFVAWHELISYAQSFNIKKIIHFSLQTKIICITTLILIMLSTIVFLFLEYHNTFATFSLLETVCNSVFNGISVRGTGFTTISPGELHLATIFLIMIVAFIGSSPGSTGSGIKTTTLVIYLATLRAAITNKTNIILYGKTVPKDNVYKALAVIAISLVWIAGATFCLLITESTWGFLDVLFEVVSAFATLGISTGVTPYLSLPGKLLIILTMLIGRIGSLTMILALKYKKEKKEFLYPEERVMLG